MNRIVFICKTCEYRNGQNLGWEGYVLRDIVFTSFTAAWEHLFETQNDRDDSIHQIESEIVEDKE